MSDLKPCDSNYGVCLACGEVHPFGNPDDALRAAGRKVCEEMRASRYSANAYVSIHADDLEKWAADLERAMEGK